MKFHGFERGINLGGWLSQYDTYDEEHFQTFIRAKDIAAIAKLGFDHVRVPVDYQVLEEEDGTPKKLGIHYLQLCREWCAQYGLNMLIDLHECYGYSFDPLKKDMDRKTFFYDEKLQERFLALWRRIAEAFKDYPQQVAFEPLNEIVLSEVADAWNTVAAKYIRMMREIVPEAYLIIGGVCYNSVTTVSLLQVPTDDYIVFNFHCYEPMIFTHQGAYWVENMPQDFRVNYPASLAEYRIESEDLSSDLAGAVFACQATEMGPDFFEELFTPAIEAAKKAGVPLYCGEYGVIDLAENRAKLRWLKDIHSVFRKYEIGSALWNYKGKDFGLVDRKFEEIRPDFIQCMKKAK